MIRVIAVGDQHCLVVRGPSIRIAPVSQGGGGALGARYHDVVLAALGTREEALELAKQLNTVFFTAGLTASTAVIGLAGLREPPPQR